jgi:hypothetical protein
MIRKLKEGEMNINQAEELLGLPKYKISKAADRGKITRVATGIYSTESVLAYKQELDERKNIPPANWIKWGTQL